MIRTKAVTNEFRNISKVILGLKISQKKKGDDVNEHFAL